MALLGGHRTHLKAPLKEVWKKLAEEERQENLEKMHDNKDNIIQEQKIMIEEMRLTLKAGYDISPLQDERGIRGVEVEDGFKLREEMTITDPYWWTDCSADEERREM